MLPKCQLWNFVAILLLKKPRYLRWGFVQLTVSGSMASVSFCAHLGAFVSCLTPPQKSGLQMRSFEAPLGHACPHITMNRSALGIERPFFEQKLKSCCSAAVSAMAARNGAARWVFALTRRYFLDGLSSGRTWHGDSNIERPASPRP